MFPSGTTLYTFLIVRRGNVPGLGPAARLLLLLLPDESGQLLPERHLFAVGLLDEGMLQQVGDGGARLEILNQAP